MPKILLSFTIALSTFFLMSCEKTDTKAYYLTHPAYTYQAYQRCVQHLVPSCERINGAMSVLNKEAIALSNHPQGYGLKVMQNQEKMGELRQALQHTQDPEQQSLMNKELKSAQILHQQQLAVIRWLESVN